MKKIFEEGVRLVIKLIYLVWGISLQKVEKFGFEIRRCLRVPSAISVKALCVQFKLTLELGINIFPVTLCIFEAVHDKDSYANGDHD